MGVASALLSGVWGWPLPGDPLHSPLVQLPQPREGEAVGECRPVLWDHRPHTQTWLMWDPLGGCSGAYRGVNRLPKLEGTASLCCLSLFSATTVQETLVFVLN